MNLKHSKVSKKSERRKRQHRQNLSGLAATLLIALLTAANVYQLNARERDVSQELFNLARLQYIQGRYDVCLDAIARVHDLTAPSKDSQQLQSFCSQGKELVKREKAL